MSRFLVLVLLIPATSLAQLVDRTQPLPQTPRQALVEVLRTQDGSAIERHMPEITKKKLREFSGNGSTGLAFVRPAGEVTSLLGPGSEKMEVFEAGDVLARIENRRTNEKLELLIESEDFRGHESDFELTIHMYKNGEETLHWYMPRILLNMKQEDGIWRFAEVGFTVKLPLSNPEFLDSVGKNLMRSRIAANSASALGALRTLHTAEVQYASTYPRVGYTCSLASLGPGGTAPGTQKQASETGAMLIDNVLASGRKSGYQFAISNCGTPPASRFTITAVPETPSPGLRAFCTDESGLIRYAADGRAETCLASGKLLQ
jgi:type IV pilus assembly protein PilA